MEARPPLDAVEDARRVDEKTPTGRSVLPDSHLLETAVVASNVGHEGAARLVLQERFHLWTPREREDHGFPPKARATDEPMTEREVSRRLR